MENEVSITVTIWNEGQRCDFREALPGVAPEQNHSPPVGIGDYKHALNFW
jgi:hypothetical protein